MMRIVYYHRQTSAKAQLQKPPALLKKQKLTALTELEGDDCKYALQLCKTNKGRIEH